MNTMEKSKEEVFKLETSLNEDEKNYKQLVNSITDVFFALDSDLRYTYWNKASEKFTGILEKDALGKKLFEIFPDTPDIRESVKVYREVLNTGIPATFNNQYKVGKNITYLETSVYPFKNGISVFVKDVTKQKYSEIIEYEKEEIKALNEELLKAKNIAEENEKKFQSLFENSRDGIVMIDSDGKIITCNKAYSEMLGYTIDELKKISFYDITPNKWHEWEKKEIVEKQLVKLGYTSLYKKEYIRKDGTVFPVELIAYRGESKNKGNLFYWGIVKDISERIKAEDTSNLVKEIVNSSNDAIISKNLNNVITSWNLGAEKIFGYTAKEIIGSSIYTLIPPERVGEEIYIQTKIKNGFNVNHFETIRKHKDGRLIDVSITFSPIKDSEGNIIGTSKIIRDISLFKKNEEELRSKEKFLRTITNVLPGMVGYWTKDLLNYFANKQYLNWFGKTEEQMKGIHIKTMMGEELFLKNLPFIEKALKGERIDFERTLTKPNGEVGYTWAHYIPDIENEIVKGFFVLVSDITEIKKSQIELEKLNKELQELNITKDKFFSIIAHDLRSPFTGLIGLTEIMSEENPDITFEEMRLLSKRLNKDANNLYKLLENLLTWAKMQKGTIDFKLEICNLNVIINQIFNLKKEIAKKKNIELISKIPDNLLVLADNNMMNVIFRNLISNAIKFTSGGGNVILSGEERENEIIVCVKDSGIGMDSEMISKIFKIDEKVSRKGTEGESSTGLGLLLCKEFVEKHKGKIWVKSEVGNGSTFCFSLPKQELLLS